MARDSYFNTIHCSQGMCVFGILYLEFPQFPFSTSTFNLLLIRPTTYFWGKLLVRTCKIFYILVFLRFRPLKFILCPFSMIFQLFRPPRLIPWKGLTFRTVCMLHHHRTQKPNNVQFTISTHLLFALFYFPSVTCNFTV